MGVAPQKTAVEPAPAESVETVEKPVEVDQADLGQAAEMVHMLRTSGNPKFANSQFVEFIDRVSKGDLQFKENTVVDRNGVEVDWDALYDTDAATASAAEKSQLEEYWQASG